MAPATRRRLLVLGASLLLGWLLGSLALTRPGYRAETQVLDRFVAWRYHLFGLQPIDERLVIVGVDAATMDRFGKPMLFWQADLARLVARIQQDQPKVVGLDFLISPKTNGLAADDPLQLRLQDEALELATVAMNGPPVILVERYASDEFSSGVDGQGYETDQVLSPHEVVRDLLLQPDGSIPAFGIANVATDPDGAVRRVKLFHWKSPDGAQIRPSNFAFRLLETATGIPLEYQAAGPRLSWNGQPVPFLFDESFLLNIPGPLEESPAPGQPTPPNQSFRLISALEVLNGTVAPGTFRDKIVLLAPTAETLDDLKVVPGDHSYHGVGLHATVINMFLTDSFLNRPSWAWLALPTLMAGLGAAIGRTGRLSLFLLGLALLPLGQFLAFSGARWWLPTLFSTLAYALGGMLGYVERLVTVERDRARVRSTFARMVSPQVMQHVLKDPKSLQHGVRKEITVLFTDINGFTPICEKHEPEEVITMLSEYFSKMVDVIMKYDGYLKQYVGDEIMVIFGAPDDRDDHATRAILTVLEMREVLAQAKVEAARTGKLGFFEIKAGLNTGSVVVGRVGPEARWEYAAVGDHVNLGARVMATAQKLGLDIGVSDATRQRYLWELAQAGQTEDPVVWTSQGVQAFKGKVSQMEVFSIERQQPPLPSSPPVAPAAPAEEPR